MGVNIASMREYFFKAEMKTVKGVFLDFIPPAIGFIICLVIWLNLPVKTFIIGGGWLIIGMVYMIIKTNGFKKQMKMLDFSVE
jgi:putrescine importer